MNNISSRSDNSQLPSLQETKDLREIEAMRKVTKDTADEHFVDFSTITALFNALGLSTDLFDRLTQDYKITDEDTEEFSKILNELVVLLSDPDTRRSNIGSLNDIYDYLAEEDKPEKVDLAIVFGGKSDARPEKAAELYDAGLVGKILCCGRGPVYKDPSDLTEAEKYSRVLIRSGVPSEAIILEKSSISIPDNVRASLNLLDEMGFKFNSLAIVTSPFSQRRSWACVKKYLPKDTKIIRVNSMPSETFSKEHWFESEQGIRVIINEFAKMGFAKTHNDA